MNIGIKNARVKPSWSLTRADLKEVTIDSFKGRNGLEYYLYQFDKDYTLPVIGFFRPRHRYMDDNIRRFSTITDAQEYWKGLKVAKM
jgi:hypothetical protein